MNSLSRSCLGNKMSWTLLTALLLTFGVAFAPFANTTPAHADGENQGNSQFACPQGWTRVVSGFGSPCIPAVDPVTDPSYSELGKELSNGVWFWYDVNEAGTLDQHWNFTSKRGLEWSANNLWTIRIKEAESNLNEDPDNEMYLDAVSFAQKDYQQALDMANNLSGDDVAPFDYLAKYGNPDVPDTCNYATTGTWISGSYINGQARACAQSSTPDTYAEVRLCANRNCTSLSSRGGGYSGIQFGRGGTPGSECTARAQAEADWNEGWPHWWWNTTGSVNDSYDSDCQ
jgi:hypothetical protein